MIDDLTDEYIAALREQVKKIPETDQAYTVFAALDQIVRGFETYSLYVLLGFLDLRHHKLMLAHYETQPSFGEVVNAFVDASHCAVSPGVGTPEDEVIQ